MSRNFDDLVALQEKLLGPDGCPWDPEQTHRSLRTYLLEETYEVLEALDALDFQKLPEELGDLLLQVVFHAELARKAGEFDIGDVVESIYSKLVRHHPHVFGQTETKDAQAVLKNWEQLKAEERKSAGTAKRVGESLLDGLPHALPATLEAFQITRRASRIGFDWPNVNALLEKLDEEVKELRAARISRNHPAVEEEIGDLLFVAVNVARFLQVDPEIALKGACRKFSARFRAMEQEASHGGRRLADVPREEMEALWDAVKRRERENQGGGKA